MYMQKTYKNMCPLTQTVHEMEYRKKESCLLPSITTQLSGFRRKPSCSNSLPEHNKHQQFVSNKTHRVRELSSNRFC